MLPFYDFCSGRRETPFDNAVTLALGIGLKLQSVWLEGIEALLNFIAAGQSPGKQSLEVDVPNADFLTAFPFAESSTNLLFCWDYLNSCFFFVTFFVRHDDST